MIRRTIAFLVMLLPLAALAQLRLTSPAPGETVHSNGGQVPVAVVGAPPEARFRVILDGAPHGELRTTPTFTVDGVDRGTHTLAVSAVDEAGREIGRTEAVEFQMWQASRLFPNRRGAKP